MNNKRIAQLAKQAVDIVAAERILSDGQIESTWRPEYYDQVFAELIVRECLDQADNIREGCELDGEDQQALGADWVGLAIARHFGVE